MLADLAFRELDKRRHICACVLDSSALDLQTNKWVNFGVDATAVSQVSLLLDGTIYDLVLGRDKRPNCCNSICDPHIFSENLSLSFLSVDLG